MQHKNQLWWEAKDSIPQTGGSSFSWRIIPPCRKITLSGPDKHFYCLIGSTCWNSNLRDISPETIKGATKLHWFYTSYKLHLHHCVSVNSGNPLADVSEELPPRTFQFNAAREHFRPFHINRAFFKTGGFLLCSKKVDMSTVRRCQEHAEWTGSDITFTLRACWPTRMLKKSYYRSDSCSYTSDWVLSISDVVSSVVCVRAERPTQTPLFFSIVE